MVEVIEAGLSAARHEVDGFIEPGAGFSDIATMLGNLDGEDFDQLYLLVSIDGVESEVVAQGGHGGRLMLFIAQELDTFYLRSGSSQLEGGIDAVAAITSGGTGVDVLARWLLPVDVIARAIWYFLLTGDREPNLTWEALSSIPEDLF